MSDKKKYKVTAAFPSGSGRQYKVGDLVLLSDVEHKSASRMGFVSPEPVKIPDAPPEDDNGAGDEPPKPKPKSKPKSKPKADPVKPDETKPDGPEETK